MRLHASQHRILHCRALQFLHPSVCEVTQMHRHLVLAEIIQSYEFAISER